EQERLQHALVHQQRALARHALIVESVEPVQGDAAHPARGGIVEDGEEERQDRLAHLPLKVCPSLSSFCRSPSRRCPTASWKSTPAASGASSAGPVYGSSTGAFCSARSSPTISSILRERRAPRGSSASVAP